MEQAIAAVFLVLFGGGTGDTAPQSPPAVVQSAPGKAHAGGGNGGHSGVPMNSPEPITMIALAGGAAAAGGLSRRRKKANQDNA